MRIPAAKVEQPLEGGDRHHKPRVINRQARSVKTDLTYDQYHALLGLWQLVLEGQDLALIIPSLFRLLPEVQDENGAPSPLHHYPKTKAYGYSDRSDVVLFDANGEFRCFDQWLTEAGFTCTALPNLHIGKDKDL